VESRFAQMARTNECLAPRPGSPKKFKGRKGRGTGLFVPANIVEPARRCLTTRHTKIHRVPSGE
jgi:hypothetical protein